VGLLFVLAAGWSVAERRASVMIVKVIAAERPPIDRVMPAKLETATFALG
jgi:hypothetical protein